MYDCNDDELDDIRADAKWQRRKQNQLARIRSRSIYDPDNTEAPEALIDEDDGDD